MAQDTKFGTFGGVFTPSILTILGVIMYLRLPWVVGHAGLFQAVGIILVAHVVSVCTGLSISSIATDKKVGAGGPYYIISRSLGLPIGGTLGLALFVGLAFSISLYVIGFSESFLNYWHIPVNPTTIRICGTITLLAVTAVTLISTALAIKTQYLILFLIALSLVSIFTGNHPTPPAAIQTAPAAGAEGAMMLFGIFFPAVTGFTAGVNMSGDLKDPKRSIPAGTIAAILVGMAVYVSLAVFFAAKVPQDALVNNGDVLLEIATSRAAVVAGIWGATLSSALGSILGAPRILQAVSGDRIMPRFLAKGYGPSNEPRNALVVSFAIAEGGILIAELDSIARIVSMVFLATYGFLNISCAIESLVSPDFRPAFKIPTWVSWLGAATCVLLMIQLDLLAMLGSTLLLAGLFLLLSKKQLTLDAGDAWEGVWSSIVRSGLWRLARGRQQQRNWRPNILAFRPPDDDLKRQLRSVGQNFIAGNGILTDIELSDEEPGDEEDDDDPGMGVFTERQPANNPYQTIAQICRFHGHAGLAPNTVLLPWASFRRDPEAFGELVDQITQLDHNLFLYARGAQADAAHRRIDVWWAPSAGNIALSTGLLRFLTRSRDFGTAPVRFLLVAHDSTQSDHLRVTVRGLLSEARIDASIRVVNNSLRQGTLLEHVARESADARLSIIGLPIDADACGPAFQREVEQLLETIGVALFIRASSAFEEVLRVSRQATISFLPPGASGETAELPSLELPSPPEAQTAVTHFASAYRQLVARFHKSCLQRVYGTDIKLLKNLQATMDRHFAALDKGLGGANPRRVRKLLNRAQSSILKDFGDELEAFDDKQLEAQRNLLEARARAFLDTTVAGARGTPGEQLVIRRPREDLEPQPGDDAELASFKQSKLWQAKLWRRPVRITAPLAELKRYYFTRAAEELLEASLQQYVVDSHDLASHLGKLLSSVSLEGVAEAARQEDDEDGPPDVEALRAVLEKRRLELSGRFAELVDHDKERIGQLQWSLLAGTRQLANRLGADLDRIDVRRFARRERRPDDKELASLRGRLEDLPARWHSRQRLIFDRARLGLKLATFQHRLTSIVERDNQALVLSIQNGVLGECKQVLQSLKRLAMQLRPDRDDDSPLVIAFDDRADFDKRVDVEAAIDALVTSTADLAAELPTTVNTLSDESIKRLGEGQVDEVETVDVPVQRLAQFLVEARFIGVVQAALEKVPALEAQAAGVAQDAIRLVRFQLSELDAESSESGLFVAEQLAPVAESGIERLTAEIEGLEEALAQVTTTMTTQLAQVVEGTNPYEIARTAADLAQHIRRHHGERAAAGARSLFRRGSERVSEALVQLVYRKSAGLLLARERRESPAASQATLVDRLLDLVEAHRPRPELLDSLPSYYRQLFYGQATINETFWVGREAETAAARRAVASFGRGSVGALVITGERGSGKTSLIGRLTSDLLSRRIIYRVMPSKSGITAAELDAAIASAVGTEGEADEVLAHLPDGTVIVIDDLETWWERHRDGFGAIDRALDLVERFGDRILFVLSLSSQAFAFLSRFRPLGDDALAVIRCRPVSAEELKSVVMLRHGSTGLKFSLDGKAEDTLSDLRLARLFNRHFDYSGGYLGAALRSWITHVRRVSGQSLEVTMPKAPEWEILDELRPSLVAILIELILHKTLSREQLRAISARPKHDVEQEVNVLLRAGLVVEGQGHGLTINPFLHHALILRLRRRGLLA